MIGGSTCHGIHMVIDVLVAYVRIIFLELKVFFNGHGSPILYRHGPFVSPFPFRMCCSGCLIVGQLYYSIVSPVPIKWFIHEFRAREIYSDGGSAS